MTEWLTNLKPGDSVLIDGRYGDSIGKVEKVTPSGVIVLVGGRRFTKHGWEKTSDRWSRSMLRKPTQDRVDEILRKKLVAKLKMVDWDGLPLDAAQEMYQKFLDVKRVLSDTVDATSSAR